MAKFQNRLKLHSDCKNCGPKEVSESDIKEVSYLESLVWYISFLAVGVYIVQSPIFPNWLIIVQLFLWGAVAKFEKKSVSCPICQKECSIHKEVYKVPLPKQSHGWVYIAESCNSKYKNYVKIGMTTNSVSYRITGCEQQATYLYSGLKNIFSWKVPAAAFIEDDIHQKLSQYQRVIYLPDGKKAIEWFEIDYDTAKKLISNIVEQHRDKGLKHAFSKK